MLGRTRSPRRRSNLAPSSKACSPCSHHVAKLPFVGLEEHLAHSNTMMPTQRKMLTRLDFVQTPQPSQHLYEACDTITEDPAWSTESDHDLSFSPDALDDSSRVLPAPSINYSIRMTKEVEHNFEQIRRITPATADEVALRKVLLPTLVESVKGTAIGRRKTLLLDLDDTLTHTINPEFNYSALDVAHAGAKTVFYQDMNGTDVYSIRVLIRPYAIQLLRELSARYEVVIFTAAQQNYANAILSLLDPDKKYISRRLFRDSCVHKDGVYLKDLRIFENRSLSNMIIVDNSIVSFTNHMSNGVYVPSYFGQRDDSTLMFLIPFLASISEAKNIPSELSKRVGLVGLYDWYVSQENRRAVGAL